MSMLLACATLLSATSGQWLDVWSRREFRADPTGPPNHVAQLAWFRGADGIIGDVKISFYTQNEESSRLETSTTVGQGFKGLRVDVFTVFPPKMQANIKYFGTPYVIADVLQGHARRTMVWRVERCRPVLELNLFPSDTSIFWEHGIIIEHTRAHNLDARHRPAGVRDSSLVGRVWKFDGLVLRPKAWMLSK